MKYNFWNIFFREVIKIKFIILIFVENVIGFIGLGFLSCIFNWVDLFLCWVKSRVIGRLEFF